MGEPSTVGGDLCSAYIPIVYGGWLDPWTYKRPGAWRGSTWPCPAVVGLDLSRVRLVCSCGCHRGEFEHELPPRAAPRTAVHPTNVLEGADIGTLAEGPP